MQVHVAQLAGGDNNADRVFVTDRAVIVLDGATAFEPVDVDPGTYADTLGATIADQLDHQPDLDLSGAVAEAIRSTTANLHLNSEASPSCTVAILRAGHGAADLYVLGDSPIYYGTDRTTNRFGDDRLAALPLAERTRYVEALRSGAGYDECHRATLADLQRVQRCYRNRADGYWIAETDPTAADHGLTAVIPAGRIAWAVLATDGAADLVDHRGRPEWSDVAQLDHGGLTGLLRRLHEWESTDDPQGRLLPRAKRHDDKTLATVPAVL
ncbi:MAG: hypothetical protein JWP75_347 [Frondihabitans sp.]|nr:hypothetical protein [Frondihabitans sp.]